METPIRFFGVLRKFAKEEGYYSFSFTDSMSVETFKQKLKESLQLNFNDFDPLMIDESAVANRSEILTASSIVNAREEIAVLPPVCGG